MAEEIKKEEPKKLIAAKDIWKIVLLGLDVLVTILLLILSIIMIAKISDKNKLASATGFWGMVYYLMDNPYVFLGAVVIPLFVLLVLNIVLTVYYYQKMAQKEKKEAEEAKASAADISKLSDSQKEALKKQLLKEMMAEADKDEKPASDSKADKK